MINIETKILGIIGNPLKQSLSPLMHNLTLQKMNLNYIYVPFEIKKEQLSQAITAARTLNISGLNVTVPFKEKVIPFLDELSTEALACGAVNVIKNENGKLIGYNTDGTGFIASLAQEDIPVKGRGLFIGAGGAARSVACELVRAGISHLDFLDLNETKAREMADFIRSKGCNTFATSMNEDIFADLSRSADIIINASPVGMFPHIDISPVSSLDMVPAHTVLCDLIYNPRITKFLSMGQARGLKTVSGLNMFIYQGAISLEIFSGVKPPVKFMEEVIINKLES